MLICVVCGVEGRVGAPSTSRVNCIHAHWLSCDLMLLCAGPNWPEFEPLSAGELALLLMSHAVHVMPSEREGFGHSINEGRAAGRRGDAGRLCLLE